MTWHAQVGVARGTSARMRCSTKATWQGHAWPTRGAGGVDMWQEATRVHADARKGRHVVEWGLAFGGTRRDREVVIFTRSRVKNYSELTNLGN